ncbi:H/ACA ribonucleoprotein complex non-core subunit NAF1 [Thraustotheca clavata]|uniref:H/ACA ribonucleoprotein complex non-core subunit NAF1 n=1 Tax=Thraustotheca clavata TaxID=74557 RepID=A0A1W0A3H0_9STRA|nr:H/ACA ribonucleoprotein complex non-core subunit NAF1 [Thraustotheca clavata]
MDVLVAASYAGVDLPNEMESSLTALQVEMKKEEGEVSEKEGDHDMEDVVKEEMKQNDDGKKEGGEKVENVVKEKTKEDVSSGDDSMDNDSEPDSEDEDTGKLRLEIEATLKREEQSSLVVGPAMTTHEIPKVPVKKVDVELTPECPIAQMGHVLTMNRATASITIQGQSKQAILDEGSVLCLANRVVLGCVDEIFGPVKLPLYLIRFEREEDIPESCIAQAPVFYATQHATYVETANLNSRGTDASNLYDEEVGADEEEFSDDEMEAEAKRKNRSSKRKQNTDTPKPRSQGNRSRQPSHSHHHRGQQHHYPPHHLHQRLPAPQHPVHAQYQQHYAQPAPGYGYPPQGYPVAHQHPHYPQQPPQQLPQHGHYPQPPQHGHYPAHHHAPQQHPGAKVHQQGPNPPHPGQQWQGPPPPPPPQPYYQQYPPQPPNDNYHYRN